MYRSEFYQAVSTPTLRGSGFVAIALPKLAVPVSQFQNQATYNACILSKANSLMQSSRSSLPVLLTLAFSFLGSCASTDLTKATVPFRSGDLDTAAAEIAKIDGSGNTDGVWIQMEKGSILKAAGKFAESQEALTQCQDKMDELLKSAGEEAVAVGGIAGAGAVMTDDRTCNYVGALWESQLVCALQMMNAMALSRLDQAQAAASALRARVDESDTVKTKAREH